MTRRKPRRVVRKPRRVVLGTGWLYAQLGNPTWVFCAYPGLILHSTRQVWLRIKGTNLRKIRLVAEVLD